jgi:hypothetical protein
MIDPISLSLVKETKIHFDEFLYSCLHCCIGKQEYKNPIPKAFGTQRKS